MEAEVRDILQAAVGDAPPDAGRVWLEVAAQVRAAIGGIDLDIGRDPTPRQAIDL